MVNFDHLDSTQFEELCFDLLVELGYTDIDWRKGTGKDASPADQGRDIEAIDTVTGRDGTTRSERWFIEVKHHKAGVSPSDLHGAVAWAQSEKPDCLLIICSNFLSNPAKTYLQGCENSVQRIRYWENKNLEQILANQPTLQDKYNIDIESSILEGIHQNHLSFVLADYLIEFDDFLEAMSHLKPEDRDSLFYHVYHEVISPEFRKGDSDISMADCYYPRVNYENFCNQDVWTRCYNIQPHTVHQWVVTALNTAHKMGKFSNIQTLKNRRDLQLSNVQSLLDKAITDEEKIFIEGFFDLHNKGYGNDAEIEERVRVNADRYNRLCEELIPKLVIAAEKPLSYSTDESRAIAEKLKVIADRSDQITSD